MKNLDNRHRFGAFGFVCVARANPSECKKHNECRFLDRLLQPLFLTFIFLFACRWCFSLSVLFFSHAMWVYEIPVVFGVLKNHVNFTLSACLIGWLGRPFIIFSARSTQSSFEMVKSGIFLEHDHWKRFNPLDYVVFCTNTCEHFGIFHANGCLSHQMCA